VKAKAITPQMLDILNKSRQRKQWEAEDFEHRRRWKKIDNPTRRDLVEWLWSTGWLDREGESVGLEVEQLKLLIAGKGEY
jgi:hypothetical protein